jgi:segregation and condensation protein B
MTDSTLPEKELSLRGLLEALLFVAPGSLTISQLAAAININSEEVEHGLEELEKFYFMNKIDRGLRLLYYRGRVQLTSAPEASQAIERLLNLDITSRLSRAALESLAIIMYQQPITRPQIDAIRGVNSDSVIKSLLFRGLIQEVGRAEAPGRPILYSITSEVLQYFGLSSLGELPPINLEEHFDTTSTTDVEGINR